jgi:hypothetical protein
MAIEKIITCTGHDSAVCTVPLRRLFGQSLSGGAVSTLPNPKFFLAISHAKKRGPAHLHDSGAATPRPVNLGKQSLIFPSEACANQRQGTTFKVKKGGKIGLRKLSNIFTVFASLPRKTALSPTFFKASSVLNPQNAGVDFWRHIVNFIVIFVLMCIVLRSFYGWHYVDRGTFYRHAASELFNFFV